MKTTVRVHRNSGKKHPLSQAQMENPAKDSVAVPFISLETGESISPGIDLTGAEFEAIKKDAAQRGESLDAWLVRTFNETTALRGLKPAGERRYGLQLIAVDEGNGQTEVQGATIDVPAGDFEILERDSRKRGDAAFSKLLKVGYEAMVASFPGRELENATAANNALLQLLCEQIEYQRQNSRGSSFSGGEESETLCFGLLKLVESSRERLTRAMEVAA
jgi:hypothetical protein